MGPMTKGTQKTILITGASSGIGAALAAYYAAQSHRLFLGGRDASRLDAVASLCRSLGAEVHVQISDTTAAEIMHQWIVSTDKRFPIDLIIANAGISGGTAGLGPEEFSIQAQRIFDVNVTGVLNTIAPVLPRMLARGQGQIALVSSLAGFAAWPGAPAYSASKGAVRMYGEALRGRFGSQGLKVSVICPGFIKTPMTDVNPYPMPLLMNADRAAHKIAQGLDKNRGLIIFPWPVALVSRVVGLLPSWLRIYLLSRAPQKTALQNF